MDNIKWGDKTLNGNLDNINKRLATDHISRSLGHSLEEYLFKRITPDTKKVVKESIEDVLDNFKKKGIISQADDAFTVGNVDILWTTWNKKQKIKWFFANKVFKFIGNRHRRIIDDMNLELYKEDEDCSRYKYKQWAIENPKAIVVSDITFRVKESIPFITMNIIL